jgi:tRNA threonylcarbamoyladenosine biosynthesis protein TsaE
MTAWRLPTRAATVRFGEAIGRRLFPGAVVALIGDVGAGKTMLTQAIARGMGIRDHVTSPTFALIHVYPGRMPLYHFDPYRLDRPDQLYDVGFLDYFEQDGAVVIEWADKFPQMLPNDRLTLTIEPLRDEAPGTDGDDIDAPRILSAHASGADYVSLLAELEADADLIDLDKSDCERRE